MNEVVIEGLLKRIADDMKAVRSELFTTRQEMSQVRQRFDTHEVDCKAFRQKMLAREGKQREKLDSVTDEVEITKNHLIKIQTLPQTFMLWGARVFFGAMFAGLGALVIKLVWRFVP
jgi:hypothetical protein